MFINDALAQTSATAAQQGSVFATVVQQALIFLIFYLLLIRPQQKRIKQHEALLAAIKKGDQVITGGGIFAKVINADNPLELTVEIAPNLEVRVSRASIRDVILPETTLNVSGNIEKNKAANSNKKNKK